jgi:hypothetical protein
VSKKIAEYLISTYKGKKLTEEEEERQAIAQLEKY